ncbi:hypothetical protein SynMITS9220M01_034 [Synechococcus phage SynMITS9220M01]|nr:hypothetical protein SynMITS9220M01_034 [Synechococcus phage SynMITS9220M01]
MALANINIIPEDRASGAMVINQSLRFSGSERLTRTFGTNSGTTWTWSAWIKRSDLSTGDQQIFGTTSPLQFHHIRSNNFGWTQSSVAQNETDLRRDASAWYHRLDVSNGTNIKMFINGELALTWTQASVGTNTNVEHLLGGDSGRASEFFKGYLADVYLIDGQELTATDFGFTDPLTNTWRPKKYEGTFGDNGFHLDFSDPDDIGADRSGRGNDWTPSGFSAVDVMKDSPSGVAYGSVPTSGITTTNTASSNYCTLNFLDAADNNGLGEGNLKCGTTTAANTTSIRGTLSVSSGKWYFEVQKITSGTINIQCGWAAISLAHKFTTSDTGVYNKVISGTTVMIAADFDRNAIWTGVDGTWDNSATVAEIESGDTSNATHTSVSNYPLAPMFLDQAFSFSGEARFNFGQRDFTHTPPSGYKPLCAANLPRLSEIALQPEKYFKTVIWDGSGTNNRPVDVGFQPGLVWIKNRNDTQDHVIVDSIRGNAAFLTTNDPDPTGDSGNVVRSFESNGVTLGTNARTNASASSRTYVGWFWKAGGAAVANNDGNTRSNISVNQEAGFSIIDYDGAGNGTTIGHGLGKKPEFILFKATGSPDSTNQNWNVYHHDITADNVLFLNLDNASTDDAGFMADTEPTDSIIHLGSSFSVSHTGSDYIAYAWTSIEGYSKFGSYTGNADGSSPNSNGPFVNLGFKPAFILFKRTDSNSGGEWSIYDSTRKTTNANRTLLLADLNNAETTSDGVDFLSNGFKVRAGSGTFINQAGTYIYAAFAEAPTFNLYGGQANAR